MSLEQAITDHASALRELAAAIRATVGAKKPAATQNAEATAKAEAATASHSDAPAPTYDDVKAKVLALSKDKGREPTVQLLERYGVAKAPDLKPEQYADFIKDVDAILSGTYNPEAAEAL